MVVWVRAFLLSVRYSRRFDRLFGRLWRTQDRLRLVSARSGEDSACFGARRSFRIEFDGTPGEVKQAVQTPVDRRTLDAQRYGVRVAGG